MDLGFLSGPIGAIFGGAAAIGQQWIGLKLKDKELEAKRLELEHELAMRDKDMQQAQIEAQSQLQLHQVDADSAIAVKELDALATSYAADKAAYGDHLIGRIVDAVRGLTRPVITAFAMALIAYQTVQALDGAAPLTADQRAEILGAAMFVAGTSVTWWFGARFQRAGRAGR